MSSQTPVRTLALPNGLTVEFYDESQPVAGDRVLVRLRIKMAVPVKEMLAQWPDADGDAVAEALGETVVFEQVRQRHFVDVGAQTGVFQELIEAGEQHGAQYLGRADFGVKLVKKAYQDHLRAPIQSQPNLQ